MSVPYTAIARYPYQPDAANASDDLPLEANQILTVTEIVDDDWLFGCHTDESGNTLSGYFPKSFVEPYTESQTESQTLDPPINTNSFSIISNSELEQELESVTKSGLPVEKTADTEPDTSESKISSVNPKLEDIESNIIHEPENFKNKLQSFNVSSTPPMPIGKPIEENFVKKAFTVSDHRTSYIPPSLGTSKPIKKEEKKPDVISGDIVSESSQVEEVEAPRMTLKERMQLLQKQQEEEQQALEAALKRKEERKKAKQLQHNHTVSEINDQENVQESNSIPESKTVSNEIGSDSDETGNSNTITPSPLMQYNQSKNIVAALEEDVSEEDEQENTNNEDIQGVNSTEDEEDGDEDDDGEEEEEEEDDDETEEDAEELRKRRLAERMAKLSGGMGMMGMMGMMGTPIPNKTATTKKTKKAKKEKKVEEDSSDIPQPIPILPMGNASTAPALGMPNSGTIKAEPIETESIEKTENVEDTSITYEGGLLSSPVQKEPLVSDQANNFDTTDDDNDDDNDDEFQDTFESATASPKHLVTTPAVDQHPYRQHFGTPTTHAPSIPVSAIPSSQTTAAPPPIPGTAPSAVTLTAPPVPTNGIPAVKHITSTVTSNEYTRPPISVPPIPGMPSDMPQTVPPSRPSFAPPVPVTTTHQAPAPTPTTTSPPPVPGSIPAVVPATRTSTIAPPPPPHTQAPTPVPVPTSFPSDNLSRHSSIRTAPHVVTTPTGSAPPVPGSIQRHTTMGHAPPPPPPTEAVPSIPENSSATGISRQLTNVSTETTTSISQEISTSGNATSELWWVTESLPPQLTKTDVYFEVVVTDIPKRGGSTIKYLIYYVLDARLTSITMQLAYNTAEPERLLFFHEEKEKNKSDRTKLIDEYTKYGPSAYNIAVKSLNKSYNGEYINFIFSSLPNEVLRPIANKTFGDVVYRNTNGESKSFDDIRPGDILVLVTSVFVGSASTVKIGFGKPHVALVTSFDPEKNRIKVIEQIDGVIKQGKYKLKNLKSGKLRVFRIVGRDYVGW